MKSRQSGWPVLPAAFGVVIVLAATSIAAEPGNVAAGSEGASLEGARLEGEWRLTGVQGQTVDAGGTLLVKDGHVSGSTGCNRFRAIYTVTGTTIKVDPVSATKMYCQDRAMVERAYLAALETVTVFHIDGGKLIMDYQAGDHMLEFAR